MPRTLLIRPFAADFETVRGVEALCTIATDSITVGPGGDYPSSVAAIRALRRDERSSRSSRFDVVHAWGSSALLIAAVATRSRLLFSPLDRLRANDLRLIRAVSTLREVQVACPTMTCANRVGRCGISTERVHIIRPGLALAMVARQRDTALRDRLGIRPDDQIILAAGESTFESNHSLALFAATVMNVMDRRNRLLVWGRGRNAASIRRFAAKLKQPTLIDATVMLGESVEFEQLLGAADEALVTSSSAAPTLPIAACLAAGLPIIFVAEPTVCELLRDRHNALFVPKRSSRMIAAKILNLRDDATLKRSLCNQAKSDADEFFLQSRFCEQFRELYRQVSDGASGTSSTTPTTIARIAKIWRS